MYKIYNEDCIEGMKQLENNSVDLILTDLPYNLVACVWDKRKMDLSALWTEFTRVLKPCRVAALFASSHFVYKLHASNPKQYKYSWYWVKNAPTFFVHAKNAPIRRVEEILVFSDGTVQHESLSKIRMRYNPQGVTACSRTRSNAKRKIGSIVPPCPSHVDSYVQEQTGFPSDVLFFNVPPSANKLHPSQKPVELLEYLIRTYTNEGEVVLDATMGSGSTGVAAINTGRRFIGFEFERQFYDIAEKRISEALAAKAQSLF